VTCAMRDDECWLGVCMSVDLYDWLVQKAQQEGRSPSRVAYTLLNHWRLEEEARRDRIG
jgi:hypothetical protein